MFSPGPIATDAAVEELTAALLSPVPEISRPPVATPSPAAATTVVVATVIAVFTALIGGQRSFDRRRRRLWRIATEPEQRPPNHRGPPALIAS